MSSLTTEQDRKYTHIFKIVLTGDSGVGKSQLLSRFTKNEFSLGTAATIGVEFSTKEVQINKDTVRAQIWDTAGQERFKAITHLYYRNAMGALLVFDIQSPQTFQNLDRWYNEIRTHSGNDCIIILVGNKSDQRHIRAVMPDDARRFAEERNINYIETSALSSTNVEQAFLQLIQNIYQNYKQPGPESLKPVDKSITIWPSYSTQTKEFSCC